jgi:predicted enzyme related to lactoylglutathione lyase
MKKMRDELNAVYNLNKEVSMSNQIVWCDIPVNDLDRSVRFYSAVLGKTVRKEVMPDFSIGILPHEGDSVGGCLVHSSDNAPSSKGILVYFNVEGILDQAIQAVEPNGGKILQEKHSIDPYGFRAIVLDSEGNRIALHSMK